MTLEFKNLPDQIIIAGQHGARCWVWHDDIELDQNEMTLVMPEGFQNTPEFLAFIKSERLWIEKYKQGENGKSFAVRVRGLPGRNQVQLIGEWGGGDCENCNSFERTIYKADGECSCGVRKHHYHCPDCGKIQQIG